MSQYPYPPQPPGYGYPLQSVGYASHYTPAAFVDLLAPARRASVLQGVLGGVTLTCGILFAAMPYVGDLNKALAESQAQMPPPPPGWTLEQVLRLTFALAGGCGLVFGLALLILCVFVRRGSRGAVIGSMAVTGLLLAMLVVQLIGGLVQAAGNPGVLVVLPLIAIVAGLFGLNLAWLAAARNTGPLATAMQQYQMQLYAFQQQQQAYAQGGYAQPPLPQTPYGPGAFNSGYAAPPAPTTPPAPPSRPTPPASNDADAPPPT